MKPLESDVLGPRILNSLQEALEKRRIMLHDPNVTAWPLNCIPVSATRTSLALATLDQKFYPKVDHKYFSLSFILFFLIIVNIIVEIEAEKSSFHANALQAPLDCDHTNLHACHLHTKTLSLLQWSWLAEFTVSWFVRLHHCTVICVNTDIETAAAAHVPLKAECTLNL